MRRTLALLLLGTAVPAVAQTPPPAPADAPGAPVMRGERPMMRAALIRADANGDGTITREEAIAAADARFDRLDADGNGTVTPEEMRAARDAMRGRDSGDGPPPPPAAALTREASRTRALEAFAHADTNGDGRIDQAELTAMRPMRGPGPRGMRGGDMPPAPPQD